MKPLWEQLKAYAEGETYPFHMPGHKRREALFDPAFCLDVTEVEGMDDLHHPCGMLRESEALAAALSGAQESFFSVNGSTAGLLSAITAATSFGDEILLARGCHRSVYNAVTLRGLRPHYVYPSLILPLGIGGGIAPDAVEAALREHPQIRAVVVTSPTYEGILSDVAGIAEAAHRRGVPLIVDEAHGAHLLLGGPASACACGADVVVQSLHKTLPALTQTALLHRMSDRVPADALREAMTVFQSSSPSYLLVASIDACLREMQAHGRERMSAYLQSVRALRADLATIPGLTLLDRAMAISAGGFDFDEGKLTFSLRGLSGVELAARLREEYHIETELALPRYGLAMTSISDDEAGFARLLSALREIAATLPADAAEPALPDFAPLRLERVHTPYEASRRAFAWVLPADSVGRVAARTVTPYPPGIPLVVAGERITAEAAARMTGSGVTLYGVSPDGAVAVEADE